MIRYPYYKTHIINRYLYLYAVCAAYGYTQRTDGIQRKERGGGKDVRDARDNGDR